MHKFFNGLIFATTAVVLAGCATASPEPPPPPVTVRVPCPAEALTNAECRPTPANWPATRVELENAYDELGVSNTACHAIVVEYAAGIAECKARREED